MLNWQLDIEHHYHIRKYIFRQTYIAVKTNTHTHTHALAHKHGAKAYR